MAPGKPSSSQSSRKRACPSCGERIPADAQKCPYCRQSMGMLRPGAPYTDPSAPRKQPREESNSGIFLTIMLIGLVIGGLSYWGLTQLKYGRANPLNCIGGIIAGAVIFIFGLKGLVSSPKQQ